jgi:hypothetical protein
MAYWDAPLFALQPVSRILGTSWEQILKIHIAIRVRICDFL